MSSKLALVDADVMVYRVGFATEDNSEQLARARLVEWFTDIVYIDLKCDDYKAWITGKSNFRYDIAKHVPYKGNRKDLKKPKHYAYLRDVLVKRLHAEVTEGEEADDAVGIASTLHPDAWIVHVDKDLDQLPGNHYNPVKKEQYVVTPFEGLQSFYKQLLTGDRTDNIEGIHGIGPTKSAKIIKGCQTEEELFEAVWKTYQKHNQPIERLLENGQLLWLRREPGQIWSPPSNSPVALGQSS